VNSNSFMHQHDLFPSDDSELESDEEGRPNQCVLVCLNSLCSLSVCRVQPKVSREAKRRKISYQQAKEAGPPNKKATLEQDSMASTILHSRYSLWILLGCEEDSVECSSRVIKG